MLKYLRSGIIQTLSGIYLISDPLVDIGPFSFVLYCTTLTFAHGLGVKVRDLGCSCNTFMLVFSRSISLECLK